MTFSSEANFESHLRGIIDANVISKIPDLVVLKYKTVADIIICRNGKSPGIFFLEVKYFQRQKGRLGFGTARGEGIQPEILVRMPDYLESNLRWVLATDSHGDGYWFVTSEQLRQYLAGGAIGQKQNNIQEALFREIDSLNPRDLTNELVRWLSVA